MKNLAVRNGKEMQPIRQPCWRGCDYQMGKIVLTIAVLLVSVSGLGFAATTGQEKEKVTNNSSPQMPTDIQRHTDVTVSLIAFLGDTEGIDELDIENIYKNATQKGKNYLKIRAEGKKAETSTRAAGPDKPDVSWGIDEEIEEGFPIARALMFTSPVRAKSDEGGVVSVICKFMFNTRGSKDLFMKIIINGFVSASEKAEKDDFLAITVIDDNTNEVYSCYVNNNDFKKLKELNGEDFVRSFTNNVTIRSLATETVKYSDILKKSSEGIAK